MNNRNLKNITILFLGTLFVATILLAIKSSTEGSKLAALEVKAYELSQQRQELSDQIIGETSLTRVNQEAIKMGMVKAENFVYINSSGIALR